MAGILGTLVMDLMALFLVRRCQVDLNGLQIVPGLLGRWVLLMIHEFRGLIPDIRLENSEAKEKKLGLVCHYVIGIVLALIFSFSVRDKFLWYGLLFGFLTNIFPWM